MKKNINTISLIPLSIYIYVCCFCPHVFSQGQFGYLESMKYQKYCHGEKGRDTILTVYRSISLANGVPSVAITADSVRRIANQIKRGIGAEASRFLRKNQPFLNDYFQLSCSTGREELVHINMCEILLGAYGRPKYNKMARKLKRIVKHVDWLLKDPSNAICELEISSAPGTVALDDVILIQRNICDLKNKCFFAHSGILNHRFFLSKKGWGYFQEEPDIDDDVGFFENTSIIVLNIPIVENNIYYANICLTLSKK